MTFRSRLFEPTSRDVMNIGRICACVSGFFCARAGDPTNLSRDVTDPGSLWGDPRRRLTYPSSP